MNKIWKDPVWSKIIASIIIGSAYFIWAKIESYKKHISLSDVLNYGVPLFYIVIGIIVLLVAFGIYRKVTSFRSSFYTKEQQKLREYSSLPFEKEGVIVDFIAHFDDNNLPFVLVDEILVRCTKHEFPFKFINGKCSEFGCYNFDKPKIDYSRLKNTIESALLHEWEGINIKK